ncbi:unannotated protein [freshwater metagenome]|uniref:Unannotated protein n=1 Tax=freshwater metagenome TaxID=449393 RepID=A0A6J6J3I8_9ZZZZ
MSSALRGRVLGQTPSFSPATTTTSNSRPTVAAGVQTRTEPDVARGVSESLGTVCPRTRSRKTSADSVGTFSRDVAATPNNAITASSNSCALTAAGPVRSVAAVHAVSLSLRAQTTHNSSSIWRSATNRSARSVSTIQRTPGAANVTSVSKVPCSVSASSISSSARRLPPDPISALRRFRRKRRRSKIVSRPNGPRSNSCARLAVIGSRPIPMLTRLRSDHTAGWSRSGEPVVSEKVGIDIELRYVTIDSAIDPLRTTTAMSP